MLDAKWCDSLSKRNQIGFDRQTDVHAREKKKQSFACDVMLDCILSTARTPPNLYLFSCLNFSILCAQQTKSHRPLSMMLFTLLSRCDKFHLPDKLDKKTYFSWMASWSFTKFSSKWLKCNCKNSREKFKWNNSRSFLMFSLYLVATTNSPVHIFAWNGNELLRVSVRW